MRSAVSDEIPVGRAPAEEPALVLGLDGHRGADADLDPITLALARAAEHGHDQVFGDVLEGACYGDGTLLGARELCGCWRAAGKDEEVIWRALEERYSQWV